MIIDVFLSGTCFMSAGPCRFSVWPRAKRQRHPRRARSPCFCGVKPLVCRRPSNNVAQQQRSRRCPTEMLQSPTAYFFECSIFVNANLKDGRRGRGGANRWEKPAGPNGTYGESVAQFQSEQKPFFLVSHHMINLVFYTPPRIHKALICIFSIFLECFALPVLFIAPHLKCGGYV